MLYHHKFPLRAGPISVFEYSIFVRKLYQLFCFCFGAYHCILRYRRRKGRKRGRMQVLPKYDINILCINAKWGFKENLFSPLSWFLALFGEKQRPSMLFSTCRTAFAAWGNIVKQASYLCWKELFSGVVNGRSQRRHGSCRVKENTGDPHLAGSRCLLVMRARCGECFKLSGRSEKGMPPFRYRRFAGVPPWRCRARDARAAGLTDKTAGVRIPGLCVRTMMPFASLGASPPPPRRPASTATKEASGSGSSQRGQRSSGVSRQFSAW